MSQYWFTPHTYGYGATPSQLEGLGVDWHLRGRCSMALSLPLLFWPADMPAAQRFGNS